MDSLSSDQGIHPQKEFLHSVFNNVAEGIITIGPDRIIETLNPAVERIFGYQASEIIGKNICMLMPEPFQNEDDMQDNDWLEACIERETSGRRKDGDVFPLCLTAAEMKVADKSRFIVIIRDVTDIRKAEAALLKCEKRFRNLAESIPVLIRLSGADAACEYFNKTWLEFTGRTLEQELGNGWLAGVHPEDLSNCLGVFAKSFIQRQSFETEYRLRRFDGKYRWVIDKGAPRFDERGSFAGFISSCSDIDDRRRMASELREVTILQRAILDSADHMIISTGPDGIITTLNPSAQRRLGYSAEELVGKETPVILHDPDEIERRARELSMILGKTIAPGFEALVAKARLGVADESEWTYTRKDGSRFTVLLSVTALRDVENRIEGFLGIAGDITERKNADDAIARLAAIIESSDDAIIGQTLDGIIISWNQSAERIYGYTAREILGENYSLLAPPSRQEEVHAILGRLNRGERVEHFETMRMRKDGALIEVSLSKSPIRNERGEITGISTIARDITGRKRDEERLRKLSLAVQQIPVSVVITDTKGAIEYVNPKFTQVTGYRADEVVGRNPRILKSGEKSPDEYKELWDTISLGGEWRGVFHNKKKNGELYWESASISPIKDADGRITHYIGIKEDISAIKKAEEELSKLSLVASKTDNAVIITDSDGCIEWVNDGFVRLTGYTLEEVAGRKPGQILQGPLSAPETVRKISTLLKAATPFTEEILNYHKDGHTYWVLLNVTPIFDDKGKLVRFISIESDITQRKQAAAALQAAKDAADAASQAKSEFLAGMSHEIRTPMNAIIGMAELLSETPLNPEQRKYVDVFRSAGETLLTIINDILDISKVEAGQIELENTGFDLIDLTEMLCEVMAVGAHQKGIELACHIGPDVPAHLVGDPGRLRQILLNLIGNAIKFTDHGQVMIEIKRSEAAEEIPHDPKSGGSCLLDFSVTDTGIGIPPDKIELVFEKFSQADASITRKYGGTGLGLSISRQLVELMGGQMRVNSEVGVGTSFSFTACFGIQEAEPAAVSPGGDPAGARGLIVDDYTANRSALSKISDLHPLRILLVDDSPENRMLVEAYLRDFPYEIDMAENGRIAIDKFISANYDLVLMDIEMPVMDGFSATRAIRAWEKQQGIEPIPILALTAYALKEETQKMLDAGCTAHLTKPIKKAALLEALAAYASSRKENDDLETSEKIVVHADADLEDIIPGFIENRHADIVSLSEALESEDFEAMRILGHTLKGVGGGYGFHFVTDLGASIEMAAGEKNAEEIGRLIRKLSDAIRSVEVVYD